MDNWKIALFIADWASGYTQSSISSKRCKTSFPPRQHWLVPAWKNAPDVTWSCWGYADRDINVTLRTWNVSYRDNDVFMKLITCHKQSLTLSVGVGNGRGFRIHPSRQYLVCLHSWISKIRKHVIHIVLNYPETFPHRISNNENWQGSYYIKSVKSFELIVIVLIQKTTCVKIKSKKWKFRKKSCFGPKNVFYFSCLGQQVVLSHFNLFAQKGIGWVLNELENCF